MIDNAILPGLDFSAYRALPGLSISTLKLLRDSPLKFKHGLAAPHVETPSMALGTAAHTAILEPRKLMTDYVLWEGGTRRGKAWDAFKLANDGKRILTAEEFDSVSGMRDSVRSFAPAMRYLESGRSELSMTWTDEETGIECRGRMDWLTEINGEDIIVDLKTTRSASVFAFGSQAAKLGYHLQLAYYFDGYHAITNRYPSMKILAVESSAPFEPALFSIQEDVILQGREEYRNLLTRLVECESTNNWPPALSVEEPLSLPSWVYGSEDSDLSGLGLIA